MDRYLEQARAEAARRAEIDAWRDARRPFLQSFSPIVPLESPHMDLVLEFIRRVGAPERPGLRLLDGPDGPYILTLVIDQALSEASILEKVKLRRTRSLIEEAGIPAYMLSVRSGTPDSYPYVNAEWYVVETGLYQEKGRGHSWGPRDMFGAACAETLLQLEISR